MTTLLQFAPSRSQSTRSSIEAMPRESARPAPERDFASTLDRARRPSQESRHDERVESPADRTTDAPAEVVESDAKRSEPISDGEPAATDTDDVVDDQAAAEKPASDTVEPLSDDAQPLIIDAGQVVQPTPAETTAVASDDVGLVDDSQAAETPDPATALKPEPAGQTAKLELPADVATASEAEVTSDPIALAATPAAQGATAGAGQQKSDSATAPSRPDGPIAPATTAVNAAGGSDASAQQNNDAGTQQQPSQNQPGAVATAADSTTTTKADPAAPQAFQITTPPPSNPSNAAAQSPVASAPVANGAEQRFAEDNVDRIVSGVKTELLPKGGSMQLRLDPPQLGKLDVTVKIQDGVLTASFVTRNDEASRLLSQTLSQLKSSLEASGVQVDRLHVQQAAPSERSSDPRNQDQSGRQQQQSAGEQQQWQQSEQQRRELLQRMWKRLGLAGDPLDVVA